MAFRFAAATLSRDTLRSGPFTVGRAVAREMPTRTSTISIQVVAAATRQLRTNHEQMYNLARRPRPRRPPSQKPSARLLALRTTGIGTSVFRWRQHCVIDACAVAFRFAAATLSRDTLRSGPFTVGSALAIRHPFKLARRRMSVSSFASTSIPLRQNFRMITSALAQSVDGLPYLRPNRNGTMLAAVDLVFIVRLFVFPCRCPGL